MFDQFEAWITTFFYSFAYSPYLVYGAICGFMILSAFGLPIPEEVILISAGFAGFVALNPAIYPPPDPSAHGVNIYATATIAFLAVILADLLIYSIGRRFGPRIMRIWPFNKVFTPQATEKIRGWTQRYGLWAVFILRFTPGARFPGHLMCGAMGMSIWGFITVDFIAAGLSVPTQVLLVAHYGQYILKYFQQFKLLLMAFFAFLIAYLMIRNWLSRRQRQA